MEFYVFMYPIRVFFMSDIRRLKIDFERGFFLFQHHELDEGFLTAFMTFTGEPFLGKSQGKT
jgi:hypothetical protein